MDTPRVPSVPSPKAEYLPVSTAADPNARLRKLQRRRNSKTNPLSKDEREERRLLMLQGEDPHGKSGLRWDFAADSFIANFPVGTQLTTDKLDKWAASEGLYAAHPGADTESDEWKAMLQRRHMWLQRLRASGIHQRRNHTAGGPFTIERVGGEFLEVRAPWAALTKGANLTRQIETLIAHKSDYLDRLIASTDWNQLDAWEQKETRYLHQEIEYFKLNLESQAQQLNDRFDYRLKSLRDRLAKGEITPTNSVLRALLPGVDPASAPADDEPFC